MAKVYGIDPDGDITPIMIRDAIVECFYQAHCEQADMGKDEYDTSAKTNRLYCQHIVRKAFSDSGGDFDKPTKKALLGVIGELKKFAAAFRDPGIIEKHAGEIMELVNKLPEA